MRIYQFDIHTSLLGMSLHVCLSVCLSICQKMYSMMVPVEYVVCDVMLTCLLLTCLLLTCFVPNSQMHDYI